MKILIMSLVFGLLSLSAQAHVCKGVGDSSQYKMTLNPLGKEAYDVNEGTQVDYRLIITEKSEMVLNEIVKVYEFEGFIYGDGANKTQTFLSLFHQENAGAAIPSKNLDLKFDCR